MPTNIELEKYGNTSGSFGWIDPSKVESWSEAHLYPPDRLNLQLTNLCNVDCTFCGYQHLKDKKDFLSDDHFYNAVEQYHAMGGRKIDLTPVVGDVLIDKKIFERISYLSSFSQFEMIKFYTNGVLLRRNGYPERLLEARPTEVAFSVPGFTRDLYERIYRSKNYGLMLRGVSSFLKLNHEAGRPINIRFSLKPDVAIADGVYTEDFKNYIEPYIDRECITIVQGLDNWGGSIRQEDLTGSHELAPLLPTELKTMSPCYYTFFASVMVDGHIRMCGCRFTNGTQVDGLVVGHLDSDTLLDVWNSDKVKRIRKNFLHAKLESVCDTCVQYSPYSGKERSQYTIQEYQKWQQPLNN